MKDHRISFREPVLALAYASVVAWAMSFTRAYFGTLVAMFFCAVPSAIFVAVARHELGRRLAFLVPLACCPLIFFSPLLIFNCVALVAVALCCAIGPRLKTRTLVWLAVACNGLTLVMIVEVGKTQLQRLESLRGQYPAVQVLDRLVYEQDHNSSSNTKLKLSPEVTKALLRRESGEGRHSMRIYNLARLHEEQYELFVRQFGFGVDRMIGAKDVEIPKLENIPMDTLQGDYRGGWRGSKPSWPDHLGKPSDLTSAMVFINEVGIFMFATPRSLGAMLPDTTKVTGFEPHGFRLSPLKTLPSWKLKGFELISLLKFPEPRAYVLDHLPRMDQLSHENVNTRPLNKFESAALSKLKSKQDIVVNQEGKSIRMVGAIRATKTCLTCHSVERGELLGAFTYDLILNGKGFSWAAVGSASTNIQQH